MCRLCPVFGVRPAWARTMRLNNYMSGECKESRPLSKNDFALLGLEDVWESDLLDASEPSIPTHQTPAQVINAVTNPGAADPPTRPSPGVLG